MKVKNKEILLYLFFGVLSFLVSIVTYVLFEKYFKFSPLIANLFSWIITVSFAYLTNRIWVFESCARRPGEIVREMLAFFAGRIATLGVEEIILFIGINVLSSGSLMTKSVAQVVVIISNYMISKIFVFNKK